MSDDKYRAVVTAAEKYKSIVAAAMRGENAMWEIADEVIRETGRAGATSGAHDGSVKKLKDIADVLVANGLDRYDHNTLGKMRMTATAFDAGSRIRGLSFAVHQEAGSPKALAEIVDAAKTMHRDVSRSFVREIKKKLDAEERAARKEAYKDALEAKKEAEAEAVMAKEEKRAANSPEAKEAAVKREQEAKERAKEAARLAQDLKGPPAVNHSRTKIDPADVPILVVRTTFSADIQKAKALAEKMSKYIEPHLDGLSDAFVASAVDELLEVAEAYRKLSLTVRSAKTNKRAHLYAVGE